MEDRLPTTLGNQKKHFYKRCHIPEYCYLNFYLPWKLWLKTTSGS